MSSLLLVHFHGLTATPQNFKEQMSYAFPVQQQLAIPYLKYVHQNTSGVALIQEIAEQISDVLIDGYPKETFVFHGNSAGGTLALACATHPKLSHKTSGLILNCSAGLSENFGVDVTKSLFTLIKNAKDPVMIKPVIETLVQFPKEDIPDWLVQEIQGIVIGDGLKERLEKIIHRGQVFKKDAHALREFFINGLDRFKQENKPVLILGGKYDTVTPPNVIHEMASKLDAEATFFDTGHVPHIQAYEKFNKSVEQFLGKL